MTSYPSNPQESSKVSTNAFSVAALLAGITSLVINIFGIIGIVALTFGIIGYRQIQTTGQKGKWFAIAGMVLGIIGIALGIFAIVIISTAHHLKG